MKKETKQLLKKGRRSLSAAELLFKKGDFDFAVSRAYYAMFYAAEAALLQRGQTYSKHAGVISGFYHQFIAAKELPQELHEALHRAFDERQEGDDGFLEQFPKADAEKLLKDAKNFIREIKNLLEKK